MEIVNNLSLIIPAYNCAKTIQRCLDSIFKQTRLPHEIIVVDDCSTDNTCCFISDPRVEIIKMPSRSYQSAARNAGAKKASGDILLFVDSDIELKPDNIEQALSSLMGRGVAAVVGVYDEFGASKGLIGRYKNMHMAFNQIASAELISWTNASFLMVRKDAFVMAGGFNENMKESICEDLNFGLKFTRCGQKIFLDKNVKIIHHKDITLSGFVRTEYKRSKSIAGIAMSNLFSGRVTQWPVRLSFKMLSLFTIVLYFCLAAVLLLKISQTFVLTPALIIFVLSLPFVFFAAAKSGIFFSLASFFILLLDVNICIIATLIESPGIFIKEAINASRKLS